MARQIINTGTTANDGTGDPLRDAASKTNANFEELYSMAGGTLEYGENSTITHNSNSTSSSFADIPATSFTLPNAGVWEVEIIMCIWNSQGNSVLGIFDSSNTAVANSYLQVPPNSNFITQNQVVRITTTASTVYKVRWKTSLGTMFIQNNTTGNSKITWKKIA